MASDVIFQSATPATPPSGTVIETIQESTSGNPQRQVVCIGGLGNESSETQVSSTLPVSAASLPLPSNAAQEAGGNLATIATAVGGTLAQNLTEVGGSAVALGFAAPASAIPVVPSVSTGGTASGSHTTVTQVASSASDGIILAANSNRLGACFYNDSTSVLYLNFSTSTTVIGTLYSVQVGPGQYYELPFNYQGQVRGIWATANGNVYVTQFLP